MRYELELDGKPIATEYRIYTIADDGRVWSAEDIEYRNDQDAIQKAHRIIHGHDVELWERGLFIARLPGRRELSQRASIF